MYTDESVWCCGLGRSIDMEVCEVHACAWTRLVIRLRLVFLRNNQSGRQSRSSGHSVQASRCCSKALAAALPLVAVIFLWKA